MKTRLVIIGILMLSFLAWSGAAETGCCINAKISACKSTELTLEECCPQNNTLAYGVEGAPDYDTCVAQYFFPAQNCIDVPECERGCCCDPYPRWATSPECKQGVFTPYMDMVMDCNQEFCSQFNLSQGGEEYPESLNCGDGSPIPWVKAEPIRGEKFVGLSFGSTCAYKPKYFRIERRSLSGTFRTLEDQYTGLTYVDADSMLNWSQTYEYRVTAFYLLKNNKKETASQRVSFTLGDMLCWQKYDDIPFCVGPGFFTLQAPDRPPFVPYFRQNLNVPEDEINTFVQTNFGGYFYNGYSCDDNNTLIEIKNCGGDEACVITSLGPKCYVRGQCTGVNPFGLFTSDPEECELSPEGKDKYCFFDNSVTLVGKCYNCNSEMDCYDYKSEEACLRNHCWANGANECEWAWVNEELGIGVCKALGKDNCKYCTTSGTGAVNSSEAHNYVFNRCTPEKLHALEVPGYPCGSIENVSCRDLVCEVVNANEGCAPNIELNSNNSIIQGSDICDGRIKVCAANGQKCMKDANGDDQPDCAPENVSCQRDRFPPRTELNSYAILTPKDWLRFKLFDKKENDAVEHQVSLSEGYKLYFCAYSEGQLPCGPQGYNGLASQPESYTAMENTTANVGSLLSLGILNFSVNYLRFFSVDPAMNVEQIKTERVKVTTNVIGGLGVFLVTPGNNSYVNQNQVGFRVRVESYKEPVYDVSLKDSTGDEKAVFYRGGTVYQVDDTEPVNLGAIDGEKSFTIVTKAGTDTVRETHIRVVLDTQAPEAPVLSPVEQVLERNFVNVSGTAEPGSTLSIEAQYNLGAWQPVKQVEVSASGNFSAMIFLKEGDWRVRARAIDKAKNPSPYSNELSFSFVKSAPSFNVVPPQGAVRSSVSNITVLFHLVSNKVPLDYASTNITLFKTGDVIPGELSWLDETTLRFIPSAKLANGSYSVLVRSVDNESHLLEQISTFEISAVPEMVTNWSINNFKTNRFLLPVSGHIWGRGLYIQDAFVDVEGTHQPLRAASEFPIKYFRFEKTITLASEPQDGVYRLVFYATNNISGTAIEPYEITLDTTPPGQPVIGFE